MTEQKSEDLAAKARLDPGTQASQAPEEPSARGEMTSLPPRWDLRQELKSAFESLPRRTSVDFEASTGVEYVKFRAFIRGGGGDLTWSEVETICRQLDVEVRAFKRTRPSSSPLAEIRSLEDVLRIAGALSRAFFRGHADEAWALVPSAFREGGPRVKYKPSYNKETFVASEFRRQAAAILPSLPAADDHLSWLLYMQHYGAATRLLDWAENALVATYFAVSTGDDSDGQLWVLDPAGLNAKSGIGRSDGLGSRRVSQLASEPFSRKASTSRRIGRIGRRQRPIAIRPPHLFPRMVAQQAVFTIHPDPDVGDSLHDVVGSSGLVWYRIPKNIKWWILKQLGDAGVSRATLFPDLDGLSVGIREASFTPPPHNFAPPSELRSDGERGKD